MVRVAAAEKGPGALSYLLLLAGGILAFLGGVWLLQGVGVLPGSFMTGQAFWAIMGAVVLVAGGILIFAGLRLRGQR